MREGVNKRQIAGLISFGTESIFTAVIGKNGGQHFSEDIGIVNPITNGYRVYDRRDGEEKVFSSREELYTYYENKYSNEIQFFKYNTIDRLL